MKPYIPRRKQHRALARPHRSHSATHGVMAGVKPAVPRLQTTKLAVAAASDSKEADLGTVRDSDSLLLATARATAREELPEIVPGLSARVLTAGLPLYAAFVAPRGKELSVASASPRSVAVLWRTEADAAAACIPPSECPDGFQYIMARYQVLPAAPSVVYGKGQRQAFARILGAAMGVSSSSGPAGSATLSSVGWGGAYKVRSSSKTPPQLECDPLLTPPALRDALARPEMWLLMQKLDAAGCHGFYCPASSINEEVSKLGTSSESGESDAPSQPGPRTSRKGGKVASTEEERALTKAAPKAKRLPHGKDASADASGAAALPVGARAAKARFVPVGNAVVLLGAGRFVSMGRFRLGGLPPSLRRIVVYPVCLLDTGAGWGDDAVGCDSALALLASMVKPAAGHDATSAGALDITSVEPEAHTHDPVTAALATTEAGAEAACEMAVAGVDRILGPAAAAKGTTGAPVAAGSSNASRAAVLALPVCDRVVSEVPVACELEAAVLEAVWRRSSDIVDSCRLLVQRVCQGAAAGMGAGVSSEEVNVAELLLEATAVHGPAARADAASVAESAATRTAGSAATIVHPRHVAAAVSTASVQVRVVRAGSGAGGAVVCLAALDAKRVERTRIIAAARKAVVTADTDHAADSVGAAVPSSKQPVVHAVVTLNAGLIAARARDLAVADHERREAATKAQAKASAGGKGGKKKR